MGVSAPYWQNKSEGILRMKANITKALSKLKPQPREILGVAIAFMVFFAIALLVNYFRAEPLAIWSKETRLEQAKGESVKREKGAKWAYCDSKDVDSFMKKGKVLIIDARPGLFYKLGHIPGAVSLPATSKELSDEARKILSGVPLKRTIVVYCADKNCENAETVAKQIIQAGYENIFIFSGGWLEWEETGRGIEKS